MPPELHDALEEAQRQLSELRAELYKRAELREQAAQVVEAMGELAPLSRELAAVADLPIRVAGFRMEWRF